jgi:hypothetical protein
VSGAKVKRILIFVISLVSFIAFIIFNSSSTFAISDGCASNHWEFPVNTYQDPQIINDFEKDLGKYDPGHRGLDLKAEVGTKVNAPADGYLLWKGVVANKPTVTFVVGHFKNTFEPVSTSLAVGTEVKKGEPIGVIVNYLTSEKSQNSQTDQQLDNDTTSSQQNKSTRCSDPGSHEEDKNAFSCLHWGVLKEPFEQRIYIDPKSKVYRKRIILKKAD